MRRGAVENLDDRKILDGFIGCYSTKKCMKTATGNDAISTVTLPC